MRFHKFFAVLIPFFAFFAHAQTPSLPFAPGERFEFEISAFGSNAGRLRLGVVDQGEYEGKALMSLAASLETLGVSAMLWPGISQRTSFLNLSTLFPLRVIDIEEIATKKSKTQTDFLGKGQATFTRVGANPKDGSDLVSRRAVPIEVTDALAGLYMLRSRPLEVGEKFSLYLLDYGRLYQVQIEVARKEKIRTLLGSKEALVVSLQATRVTAKAPSAPKFVSPKGTTVASVSNVIPSSQESQKKEVTEPVREPDVRANLWLSADTDRLPLQFEFGIGKISLSAKLSDYTPIP